MFCGRQKILDSCAIKETMMRLPGKYLCSIKILKDNMHKTQKLFSGQTFHRKHCPFKEAYYHCLPHFSGIQNNEISISSRFLVFKAFQKSLNVQ